VILAQDLFWIALRISSFQQNRDKRGHLGNILQAVRRCRFAIEIAPDPASLIPAIFTAWSM
jgi:hypothetical protein